MSILLAHTMTAPHVQQAARALHEAGLLHSYVTALRDRPDWWVQRTACALARLAGHDLSALFRRRAVTEVPVHLVSDHPWGEILRLLAGRLDGGGTLTDLVWERTEPAFDRAVARHLDESIRAVYSYEFSALHTFRRARCLGIATIYETPAPEPAYVQSLLARETARFPELQTSHQRHLQARAASRHYHRREEWDAADLVIANSKFTCDSFASAGCDVSKVRVVPLGAPPAVDASVARAGGTQGRGPLQLIWAGTFSIRKGAHHLLEAWRQAKLSPQAELHVYGSQALPGRLLEELPAGIAFHGSVPRPQLLECFQWADLLVFPTLCDGFGMVVTEAWSQGLPVLTTSQAGAAESLHPGKNGLLVPPADPAALGTALHWCMQNRPVLQDMRTVARDSAAAWQWTDYRQALVAAVRPALSLRS